MYSIPGHSLRIFRTQVNLVEFRYRCSVLEVDQHAFQRAAIFANQANLRVRSGDALHLAIAAGEGLPVVTLDQRMLAAAKALGIVTTGI